MHGVLIEATWMDARAHAIESVMSTTSNSLTERIAGEAARLIFSRLLDAQKPDAAAAREPLLHASFLGGVALNAGVVLGHKPQLRPRGALRPEPRCGARASCTDIDRC